MSAEAKYWLGLSMVSGIGAAKIAKLQEAFGSAAAAWQASDSALQGAGLDRRARQNLLELRVTLDLEAAYQQLQAKQISLLYPAEEYYPPLLREVALPPPLLYCLGDIRPVDGKALAIVGSRRMSQYGRQITRELVTELVQQGVTIVSGLARGIDTVAHRTALAQGGRTIAVLGSGLDRIYPGENRQLARDIVRRGQGAILTEYALGTKPDARHFPPRNRIISGLSRGVVVIEAGEKSGALITTTFALEQDREVFAVPGPINSPLSQGTNNLIQQGATMVTSVADILQELRWQDAPVQLAGQQMALPATSDEVALWTHLTRDPLHVDELCRLVALPASTVNSTLALMELKGLVQAVAPLHYVKFA